MLWELDEHAWLCSDADAWSQAGDALGSRSPSPGSTFGLTGIAAQRIEHDPLDGLLNGVAIVDVLDLDATRDCARSSRRHAALRDTRVSR